MPKPPLSIGQMLLAMLLVACGPVGNGQASATFPQHEGFGLAGPAGATSGTIERRSGCLMYAPVANVGPALLVWPTDFAVAADGVGVAGDERVLLVGDAVVLGGGEYTDESWVMDRLVGPTIAPECRTGRYVLVTSVIESPQH